MNSGETSALRPMSSAPTDGTIILSFWGSAPVMIAWVEMPDSVRVERSGIWPFGKREVVREPETGWRVLMLNRHGGYSIHGNYGPFDPPGWAELPPASAMSTGTAKTPKAVEGQSPASATAESRDAQTSSAPAHYGQAPTAQVIGDSLCGKAGHE